MAFIYIAPNNKLYHITLHRADLDYRHTSLVDAMSALLKYSSTILIGPWWLVAVLVMNPIVSVLRDGTWVKLKTV